MHMKKVVQIPIGFSEFHIVKEAMIDCHDVGASGYRVEDDVCSNVDYCSRCIMQRQSVNNIVTMLVEKKLITKAQALELTLDGEGGEND